MNGSTSDLLSGDMDGLRLFGLGRIPRCGQCLRYAALVDAYQAGCRTPGTLPSSLPAVPAACHVPYCSPIVLRLSGAEAA